MLKLCIIPNAMENEILAYLTKYVSISDELKEVVVASSVIRRFEKGTVLLEAEKPAKESYLVLKGCLRSYLVRDGEEKTIEFYTEEQPVAPTNYGKGEPSGQYLVCAEDATLLINTPEHEAKMFREFPAFESVCRIMSEAMMANHQESFTNYKLMTTEERYLHLLETRPDLFQRIPQYQIASYLGITAESLSRLRKRLTKKLA